MVTAGHLVTCGNRFPQIPQACPAVVPPPYRAHGRCRTHGFEAPRGPQGLCFCERQRDRSRVRMDGMAMGALSHADHPSGPLGFASYTPCHSIRRGVRSAASRDTGRVTAALCLSFKQATRLSGSDNCKPRGTRRWIERAGSQHRGQRIALTHRGKVTDNHAGRSLLRSVSQVVWEV